MNFRAVFPKPHFTLSSKGFWTMSTDLTNPAAGGVPDWVRKAERKQAPDNIDSSDMQPPRVKLLQGVAPELRDYPGQARLGEFWLDSRLQSLGKEFRATVITRRKSYILWPPRGAGMEVNQPLAVARDGVHWDQPDAEFTVRFPNNPRAYVWRLKGSVQESGLDKFGSARSDDPKSPPAATLTYDFLMAIDLRSIGEVGYTLAVVTNTRSGVKAARKLLTMMQEQPGDYFLQMYRVLSVEQKGPNNEPFYAYQYRADGYVDQQIGAEFAQLHKQWHGDQFANVDTTASTAPSTHDDEVPF